MKGMKTGGRTAGTLNKATAELKDLARQHTGPALAELARLSLKAESEQARVAAIKELFDRGYGKAAQPLTGDSENPIAMITKIETVIIDPANPAD